MTMTDDATATLAAATTGLLLGGRWVPVDERNALIVDDPATGRPIASVADATLDDAREAIAIADATQASWAATAPRERGEILRRAYESMMDNLDELALLMTLEMGKPLAESRAEVAYAADYLRWFSEEAVRITGSWRTSPDGASRLLVLKSPVGPCLFVTPWNFPLAMGTRKIGPALAAGCTVIVKPAKQTPLSMLALARILQESGLPDGVLSILPTSDSAGVVSTILADKRLRKLSFTGSTGVGEQLAAQAVAGSIRVSLELGGNAPFIVFGDADIEKAVDGAMLAKLRNNGEACTAANRFYVHRSIADEFTAALSSRFDALRIGAGYDSATTLGPLIDRGAVAKVDELVDDAIARGASIVGELQSVPDEGAYRAPAVLANVPFDARIVSEEIFGPIAPVVVFDDEDQVVEWANSSEYGLASYIFTQDLTRAIRVIEALDTGMVGVNRGVLSNVAAPFGGVKSSGYGREGGDDGIEEYLETKYAAVDMS